jgi:serine protease
MRMLHRPVSCLLALLAASTLAACGGGGGSGKAVPQPQPTAAPSLAPGCKALSPQSGSTYTLTSNPSGVPVQRIDPTNTTCIYFSTVTQASDTPQTAPHPWQYVFAPAQASPYIVTVSQAQNGNHTLFYNQAGDSTGTVNVSSLKSVGRSAASVSTRTNELHRSIQRFSGGGVSPDVVLVRFNGGSAQMRTRAHQIATAEGVASGAEITTPGGTYEQFIRVPTGTDAASFAAKLRAQQGVAEVFPVHLRRPLAKPAMSVSDPHMQNQVDQWYLFADGFPNAWSYDHGTAARIAVIDTGIDLNNTDITKNLDFSFGYVTPTHTAQDTNGHGTNVTGIAAAITNNALGFAGGGFNVRLLAYNIFGDTSASSHDQFANVSDEVSAINDAVTRRADVISLSLGAAEDYSVANGGPGDGFDQGEHDAIAAAISAGVTVVAAAGNDADGGETGRPHTLLDYPAAYDGVIPVGASGLRDNNSGQLAGSTEYVTSYSQYGPGLGVVAPGGDPSGNDQSPLHWIWNYSTTTANFPSDKCTYANGTLSPVPTNCSAFFAGTSQATPQVAAAAALLISAAGGHGSLSPARVARLIDDTADNINDSHQMHGRLNIYKAIAALTGDSGATYTGPSVQKTNPTQLIAFAYSNSGSATPQILDANYPSGVPVDATGAFRIADVPASAGTYHVAVWYDANGDGVVNAGDQFGAGPACNAQQKCVIGSVTLTTVGAAFTLP